MSVSTTADFVDKVVPWSSVAFVDDEFCSLVTVVVDSPLSSLIDALVETESCPLFRVGVEYCIAVSAYDSNKCV